MDIGSLTGQIAIEDQLTDKLTMMSAHVKQFAENFDGAFGVAAISVGVLVGAVAGAVISIEQLGEKGSVILGVENSFNRLAEAAGQSGEALIEGLSKGVEYTVDSMELMQSMSRAMTAGVKLTADDMEMLGGVARELGKATGTDATQGLNTLSMALVTGNDRMLKRIGIQIDEIKAEEAFAAANGLTRDQLNETGKIEARRIALLDAARIKLEELGTSEVSFKERIQQASVSVGNWVDSLAKAVATSPNVSRAMDAIQNSLVKAFGGDSQKMLDTIVGWINAFADGVARYAPPIIETIGSIWNTIKMLIREVREGWDLVPDWFKNIARDAALAGGAVYLTSGVVKQLGPDILGTAANFATMTSGLKDLATILEGRIVIALVAVRGQIASTLVMISTHPVGAILIGLAAVAAAASMAYQSFVEENLARETLLAQQPLINKAIAAGAAETIDYAGAVEHLAKQERDRNAENEKAATRPQRVSMLDPDKSFSNVADEHKKQIEGIQAAVKNAIRDQGDFTEAFGKTAKAVRESTAGFAAYVPQLDKMIANGQKLNAVQDAYYTKATATRLGTLASGEALLKLKSVTLEQIEADEKLGLTLNEMAHKYGNVLPAAITSFKDKQNELLTSTRRLKDLQMELNGTLAEQAKYRRDQEFADSMKGWTTESEGYAEHLANMTAIRKTQEQLELLDMAAIHGIRLSNYEDTAKRAEAMYAHILTLGADASDETIARYKKEAEAARFMADTLVPVLADSMGKVADSFEAGGKRSSSALSGVNEAIKNTGGLMSRFARIDAAAIADGINPIGLRPGETRNPDGSVNYPFASSSGVKIISSGDTSIRGGAAGMTASGGGGYTVNVSNNQFIGSDPATGRKLAGMVTDALVQAGAGR